MADRKPPGRRLLTSFDGFNWTPTSWAALGVVAIVAVGVGVLASLIS